MSDEARRFYNQVLRQSDPFPVPGTYWFRDWFHPLWRDHGAAVMVRFFALLGRHFPADGGQGFARHLSWGEFVHFMSGAAGEDLRPLASRAFGWPQQWREEHRHATQAFPGIHYDRPPTLLDLEGACRHEPPTQTVRRLSSSTGAALSHNPGKSRHIAGNDQGRDPRFRWSRP
jgi:hypothetical protein